MRGMNTVLKYLNVMLDGNEMDACIPTLEDAREAVRTLELFPIAAGALDTLLKHPGDKEGIAHAQRCQAHLQESEARAAKRRELQNPKPPAPKLAPIPQADDLDDLA